MGIYESAAAYAKELNVTEEQAAIRVEHFTKAKQLMDESRICPTCKKKSLACEWEVGVNAWIHCTNEDVSKDDGEGGTYLGECEFTNEVKSHYLFAFEIDFDVVLAMSCSMNIHDPEAVMQHIGSTWEEFVNGDMESLLKQNEENAAKESKLIQGEL